MSAASRALRGCTGDEDAASARRSSEFMAVVQMKEVVSWWWSWKVQLRPRDGREEDDDSMFSSTGP
jgi:hypothetical protein